MNRLYPTLVAVVATYVISISVHAEEVPADTVVVTATRTAQTVDETLAPVTIITRDDIERRQAKTVEELLNGLAGVGTSVSGGYGKTTSVYLRGTNDSHVVVLVDGVRLGSATLGTYSWEFLPIEQIERIEIVRGPRSSLYGPDAVGGVIQIFTRKGKEGIRTGATAGYGKYRSSEVAANVSGADAGTHFSVAASHFATRGIDSRKPAPEFSGGPVYAEPDPDGYRNKSASARVGHRFTSGAEIEAQLMHVQGHTHYDGSFVNETDFIQNTNGLKARFAPTGIWNVTLQTGHSRDETDNFKNGAYMSTFNTRRRSHVWQNDLTLGSQQLLTLGIDARKELVESSSSYNATSRRDKGYFVQHQAGLGDHDLLLGLRRDDTYGYGAQDTGNIAWGYALIGDRLRVTTSYGTAFKAPTFNQLYDPFVGNPNIKPEEAESYDVGLRGKTAKTAWAMHIFQTNVENLIVFQPPTYQAVNIDRARIRGLENELGMTHGANRLQLNLTFLDPRDATTGALLPRRAKRSLKLDDEYRLGQWRLGATWLAESYRYDDPQNTVRLGGYGLLDLRAQVDFAKDWFIRGRFGNVLDKNYTTAANYYSQGRNYFLSVGYQTQ
jgi:vitamin B12 transporter